MDKNSTNGHTTILSITMHNKLIQKSQEESAQQVIKQKILS